MAFQVPKVCSKCGKEPQAKNGVIQMRLTPEPVCSDCEPPSAPPDDVDLFASMLNGMEAQERSNAIYKLKEQTMFCWDCGKNFRKGSRTCYCRYDE